LAFPTGLHGSFLALQCGSAARLRAGGDERHAQHGRGVALERAQAGTVRERPQPHRRVAGRRRHRLAAARTSGDMAHAGTLVVDHDLHQDPDSPRLLTLSAPRSCLHNR